MRLKRLEVSGFKSFGKKAVVTFDAPVTAIVGPNGSGKSNIAEALRWVLGEQSMKSLRGKRGEDLIFGGTTGVSRLSRATVTLIFDNSERKANLDYDEVAIEREVHRDGVNTYSLNGTQVRLRDVLELLSSVSLGSTGHHIISQGEADRLLLASPTERKEMLEEALGLRAYQYKISESEKRLEKTQINMKEVESLRREIAPHLKFLKKQIDEIEKVRNMRSDLASVSREYFALELTHVEHDLVRAGNEERQSKHELEQVEASMREAKEVLGESGKVAGESELRELESKLRALTSRRDELTRLLGRLEGQLAGAGEDTEFSVENASTGERVCKYCGQKIVTQVQGVLDMRAAREAKLAHLKNEQRLADQELSQLLTDEQRVGESISTLRESMKASVEKLRVKEREWYELRAKDAEVKAKHERASGERARLEAERDALSRELAEISVIVNENLNNNLVATIDYQIGEQAERRKRIDRMKLRIEDSSVGGADTVKEYDETVARDTHLAGELDDLAKSILSLKTLLADLQSTLQIKFKEGLDKVNKEFDNFFKILFDGGSAGITLVTITKNRPVIADTDDDQDSLENIAIDTDEQEVREGIELNVNLPKKKVRGLEMLSGGERALTSIALLFAMSQVNPPPFLVLDETDAALDEANSRRYGEMLESLAKKSQLIVITHNRETMSHAQVLYGVTMGADGVSRLLSIKFDDATSYAK